MGHIHAAAMAEYANEAAEKHLNALKSFTAKGEQ